MSREMDACSSMTFNTFEVNKWPPNLTPLPSLWKEMES